jgi:hypothetical protein
MRRKINHGDKNHTSPVSKECCGFCLATKKKKKSSKIIYAIRVGMSPIVWLSPYARAKGAIPCDTVSCPCMGIPYFEVALGRPVKPNETVKFRVEEVK